METFLSSFPKSLLPSDYGGECGSLASMAEEWEQHVLSNREFLEEQKNYGVDEKKRVGRPKNPETLFGSDGTFKKLEID